MVQQPRVLRPPFTFKCKPKEDKPSVKSGFCSCLNECPPLWCSRYFTSWPAKHGRAWNNLWQILPLPSFCGLGLTSICSVSMCLLWVLFFWRTLTPHTPKYSQTEGQVLSSCFLGLPFCSYGLCKNPQSISRPLRE